jgi:hypothetical protein
MLEKLTTWGRSHLKQITNFFKQAIKVIKNPNRCIDSIEGKSSQVLVNVLKPYFIKFFEFQNLPHILKPLLGPMLHIGKMTSNQS